VQAEAITTIITTTSTSPSTATFSTHLTFEARIKSVTRQ
jgi:hypothetical protein